MKDRPTLRKNTSDSSVSRRDALIIGVGALGSSAGAFGGTSAFAPPASAADEVESHGMSAFGDLKYPPDFTHFDYVDPNVPKGGAFSQLGPTRQFNQNFLTFNTLNVFILKGDGALGIQETFATLMAPSTIFSPAHDEPDALYGLVARAVRRLIVR